MTYNFDPDKWFDDQVRILKARQDCGELTHAAYERELGLLEQRLEEMWRRLNNTYQVLPDH